MKRGLKGMEIGKYRGKLLGAITGRCAGCTLGVPVENYTIEQMKAMAFAGADEFPPVNYWSVVRFPDNLQYEIEKRSEYMRSRLRYVPVDDDITYLVLNMLLLKKFGKKYTLNDVAELWLKELPYACTAEHWALEGLKAGKRPEECGENKDNELIGAAIRADAFGYVCPGEPGEAAKLSYNDAYLTHRGDGIYGEMFAAATIAAAFTADTPLGAARAGAAQIPAGSKLKKALDWAFDNAPKLKGLMDARARLDAKFKGMSIIHTINNMCAVVFALALGGSDFTALISNSVALGLDNDCNGATVGSIAGAYLGFKAIPEYWYKPFNDTVNTYLNMRKQFSIKEMAAAFEEIYRNDR